MLFDSHTHTEFSADSSMHAKDALTAAEAQEIGIVFTEHIDFSYPGDLAFAFSPEAYWETYAPLRGARLRLGVEVGLVPGERAEAEAFLARAPFDEVIGSIHLVNGRDIYDHSTYEGATQDEFYHAYLTLMARMVRENPYIDTLGHIDYIARYAPYEDPGVSYARYAKEIDDVLIATIETDTAMEINTRRFGDPKAIEELTPIYARYQALGGKYVTLGSDAHNAEAVGNHLRRAEALAHSVDLVPVTFCKRQREMM